MHLTCAFQCCRRSLGQAKVTDLAGLHKFSHGTDSLLNRRLEIDSVLIIQIDRINAQALQAAITCTAHILRTAIHTSDGPSRISHSSELRGNENVVAFSFKPASDELFILVGSIHIRRVEE